MKVNILKSREKIRKEKIRKEITIYNLKLHEIIDIGHFSIFRVTGGWIYVDKSCHTTVFVPFNNEFQ